MCIWQVRYSAGCLLLCCIDVIVHVMACLLAYKHICMFAIKNSVVMRPMPYAIEMHWLLGLLCCMRVATNTSSFSISHKPGAKLLLLLFVMIR